MDALTSFSANLPLISMDSRITLPLWLFWLLIGLVGALLILLLIRDKALRRSLKNVFSRARRRVKKGRLEGRIKKESKGKDSALVDLGEKAWSTGVKLEAASDVINDLQTLERKSKEHVKEVEAVEKEIEKLQNSHDEYRKNQDEKIKLQEEAKSPYVEHLNQTKDSLGETEADLSHIEREIRASEKEKNDAQKEITKIEENTKLSDEIKKIKIEELNAKVFEMTKKKEELSEKQPAIEEQKAKLDQQKVKDQEKIKEFDKEIAALREEDKERQKAYEKEMKQWQKKKDTLLEKNKEIEKQEQPLFARMGKIFNEQRIKDPALADIYSRIDAIDKAVQEYETRLSELEK